MNHYGDVSKIDGGEIEPYPIAVTKSRKGARYDT